MAEKKRQGVEITGEKMKINVEVDIEFWGDSCDKRHRKCQFLKEGHYSYQHGYIGGFCLIYEESIKRNQITGEYCRCIRCIEVKK